MANLTELTRRLSAHMDEQYTAGDEQDSGGLGGLHGPRTHFEMVGCDYMLDEDWKAWLLEVNTGPVVKPADDTDMLHGVVGIVFDAVDVPPGADHKGWLRLDVHTNVS